MHIRRSLLALLLGGILLFSLSAILWFRSSYVTVFPWAGSGWTVGEHSDLDIDDGRMNLDHGWLDPKPGDNTLRKNLQGIGNVDASDDFSGPIRLRSPVLQERLQSLVESPALSHSQAVAKNEEACPRHVADMQVNQDQLRNNRERWFAVSISDIRSRRRAIVRHLEQLEKEGTAVMGSGSGAGEGRGVVMTGGNKDTAKSALVTLRMLRLEYNSTLPVQIFSFPGEIKDETVIADMHGLGATLHELEGLEKVSGAWKNFHLKAAAILASTFAEVLYLDSDNVPLRDPEYLFHEPAYKDNGGAVFWPDFNKDHPDNAVWRIMGRSCSYDEWEVESGQILIDKRGNNGLNLAALHIANHMQANHDFWFLLAGGDKDTFRYAFWALRATYFTAPRWLSALGTFLGEHAPEQEGRFCGLVMLQYDIVKNERGEYLPLFLHANLLKHRYYGWRAEGRRLFQAIKRASRDVADERSLRHARSWVYNDAGLCVDLEVKAASDDEAEAGQKLITEPFEEVYEGVFKDVEGQWLQAGGKAGGW